jgi:hypothetical protein
MKPTDEAVKRWWQWRYGYDTPTPDIKKMWLDFSSWRELEKDGGGLTYKQMYYEKIQEIAEEQYKLLVDIKTLPNTWKVGIENLDGENGVDYTDGMEQGITDCIDDLESLVKRVDAKPTPEV